MKIVPYIYIVCVLLLIIPSVAYMVGYINPRLDIDQEVSIHNISKNTYNVTTCLWVIYDGELILEDTERKIVACDDIPKEKQRQMDIIEKAKQETEERLKTFKKCENY